MTRDFQPRPNPDGVPDDLSSLIDDHPAPDAEGGPLPLPAVVWARTVRARVRAWIADAGPWDWALAGGALLVAAAVGSLAVAIVVALSHAADRGAHWALRAPDWPLTRTIGDPVQAYLQQHAAALPITAEDLTGLWAGLAIAFWFLASIGVRSARTGWVLLGALTTAMAYAGSPATNASVAAGLTAATWAVLSLTALRPRPHRGPDVVVVPARPATATGHSDGSDHPDGPRHLV